MGIRLDIDAETFEEKPSPEPILQGHFKVSPHVLDLRHLDAEKSRPPLDPRGRGTMLAVTTGVIFLLNLVSGYFRAEEEGLEVIAEAKDTFKFFEAQDFSGAELALSDLKADSFLLQADSAFLEMPEPLAAGYDLMDLGFYVAEVGQTAEDFQEDLQHVFSEDYLHSRTEALDELFETKGQKLVQLFHDIQETLNGLELPISGYEELFQEAENIVNVVTPLTEKLLEEKEAILTALGDDYPQTYLLLFQNDAELRPWGGFPGSFATFIVNDGRISNLEFWDVYKLDGRFFETVPVPVPEIQHFLGKDLWRFRDAGISPDFSISAQYAIWLFELEGGPSLDGVIAINASAATELFQALFGEEGSFSLESLPEPLPVEDWNLIVSTLVEAKVYGTQNPKAIIGEILELTLEELKNPETQLAFLSTLLSQMQSKQISLYHRDPKVQAFFDDLGVSGTLPDLQTLSEQKEDYLMISETSLGGNKGGQYIQRNIHYATQIMSDGSVLNTVTLTYTHTGSAGKTEELKKLLAQFGFTDWTETLEAIMTGPYKMGVRFYFPEGVDMMDLEGIDETIWVLYPDEDLGVPYYYTIAEISPGESLEMTLNYSLPWKVEEEVTSHFFQQLGSHGELERSIYAGEKDLLESYPQSATVEDLDYHWEGPFQDIFWTLLFEE